MELSVERNTNPETREEIPYHIRLEIVRATADRGKIYHIPVYINYVGIYKHFHVKICGVRLDTQKKPHNLLAPVKQLCRSLINVARFPSYVFIARRAGHVYPAYTIGDEVFITTQGGGPVFRHVELAKIRGYLTDYLHDIKVLGKDGKSDKLHARGIDPHTLGLRRPVLYLKKRVLGQEDFWAPVFESGDRKAIYALAASARRQVEKTDGREVLHLRDLVAQALQNDGRLADPCDLRPDRLMPQYWHRLESTLSEDGEISVNGRSIPLYRTTQQQLWLGLEHRLDEERYGLFIGHNPKDIHSRISKDFARRDAKYY